jgi:hypothetical protein
MENTSFFGPNFSVEKYHRSMKNYVKSILKVTKAEKDDPEQPNFPESFTKVEEGERHLDEAKPPEWMNVEIKTKEFNILYDDRPKMEQVGYYWPEK